MVRPTATSDAPQRERAKPVERCHARWWTGEVIGVCSAPVDAGRLRCAAHQPEGSRLDDIGTPVEVDDEGVERANAPDWDAPPPMNADAWRSVTGTTRRSLTSPASAHPEGTSPPAPQAS